MNGKEYLVEGDKRSEALLNALADVYFEDVNSKTSLESWDKNFLNWRQCLNTIQCTQK